MHYSYLIPKWFFGFDIGMEALFAIITLFVAFVAFKIHKVTGERKIKLFGIGFMLIGLSYIVFASLNYWFAQLFSEGFKAVSISEIQLFGMLSAYVYMVLFISGLVTLTFVTADMKKGKTYYLLISLSMLVLAASLNKFITFRILGVFLLSFIVYQYLDGYLKNKNKKWFWILVAFTLLLLSSMVFIFSAAYTQAYILGHFFELLAYLIIAGILVKTFKK